MKHLLFIIALALCTTATAQPTKRRTVTPTTKTAATAQKAGVPQGRPQQTGPQQGQGDGVRQFPTAPQTTDDVVWRRDVYRTLDLMEDANAPLYYPVEPTGKQMNLFTYVFRLMLTGRIHAYQYTLDGSENFDAKNRVDMKDLCQRYGIFYEEQGGKLTVAPQDIPGAEVTRYYIKESCTFDQRTSTFQRRVTALCPVLMRTADEFSSAESATPYPLFWLNMDEVADYLQKLPMMASNYNNVTNMTAGDYFAMNRYDGKIYKTNNLQGRTLSQYCRDTTELNREQKRIEQELVQFEQNVWSTQRPDTVAADSTVEAAAPKRKATARKKADTTSTRRRDAKTEKAASTPARASVRRERR